MAALIADVKATFSKGNEKWVWEKKTDGWVLEGIYLGGKKLGWEKTPGNLIVYENNSIVNYKLIFDQVQETPDGLVFSGSNELYEVKKIWFFGEDTPKLVFAFKAKKRLEIDLLEAPVLIYAPKNLLYSFIGGLRYSKNSSFDVVNRVFNFPYPFSTYYKVKIPPREINGSWYRSLIYCKMPLALYNSRKYYFGLIFNPVEKTSSGRELLHSIRFDGAGLKTENTVSLSYCTHMVYSKRNIWLGLPSKPRRLKITLNPLEEVYTTVNFIYGLGKWYEAVEKFFKVNPLTEPHLTVDPKTVASKTKNAFWRAWESRLKTFLQLPFKRSPGFLLENLLFSLTSFDAERLSNFYDYYTLTGDRVFKYWVNCLRSNLLSRRVIEVKNNYKIWHNGIAFNGVTGEGYTYLWTGYAGYPGGQATIVFRLLEYYSKKLQTSGLSDQRVLNNALDGLDWILSTQKRNGAWRSALKIFREYPARRIDYSLQESVGGSAECIRALILAFKLTRDRKYRDAAVNGLKWLNGKGESVLGYNYLRDAGVYEEEGISAIVAAQANLDAYEAFQDDIYYKYSLIWGKYLLTWHYLWESERLKIRFGFDPLSWSITPRVAPYETAMVLSVYSRLYKLTGDDFWKKIFIQTYNKLSEFQESDGGLSETYFFNYLKGLAEIPVQQTFAANELLKASIQYMNLDSVIKFNVEGDKIIIIERNNLLKEIIRTGNILQVKLSNNSDHISQPFKLVSNILDKSTVFIADKEVASRRGCEVYGLRVNAKSDTQITIKMEPSKSPSLTMYGVEDYSAAYDSKTGLLKLEYTGGQPRLNLIKTSPGKIFLTLDRDKATLIELPGEKLKTVKVNLPPGHHTAELSFSDKTELRDWADTDSSIRIPLLIYPKLISNKSESLVRLKADKIIQSAPFQIKKSLIKFLRGKEEIPFYIPGKSEILESQDEIILKLRLDKPAVKIHMYYGSQSRFKPESDLKANLEKGWLNVFVKDGARWINQFTINRFEKPEIVFNSDSSHSVSLKLSFWDAYSKTSRFLTGIRKALRKYSLRLLLGLENIRDLLYGVADRKISDTLRVQSLEKFKVNKYSLQADCNPALNCLIADYRFETDLHRVIAKIYVLKNNNSLYLVFNPLKIRVMQEDLKRTWQSLTPLITGDIKDFKSISTNELQLTLNNGKSIKWMIFDSDRTTGTAMGAIRSNVNSVGVDVSLKTNWVHAGEYYQYSSLIVEDGKQAVEGVNHLEYLCNFSSTDYIAGAVQTRKPGLAAELTTPQTMTVKPLKIALIYPGAAHGIYHYVRHLRNMLKKQGLIVKGFYFPEEKVTKPMMSDDKPLTVKLKIGEFYFVLPDKKASNTILEKEYKKDPFDIIHLHWPTTTWDSYVFEFAEKYRLPLCVNLHYALSLRDDAYGLLSRLMYNISKRYLRKSDRIVVTSKAQENFVKSLGYPSVTHIPTGVDVNYFKPCVKLPSKIKTILYVGRISPEKNVEALIKAFKKCDFKGVRLVLVGKGPLLKRLRSKYIGGDVLFTGYISEAEKLKYLQNSDLFVTATKMELMSIAVLEAMAAGLPVVTSRLEAFEEFVTRDVGRMIELNKDFEDNLAATMKELIGNDRLRAAMGKAAREKAVRLCSWDIIGAKFKKLYESMVQPHVNR